MTSSCPEGSRRYYISKGSTSLCVHENGLLHLLKKFDYMYLYRNLKNNNIIYIYIYIYGYEAKSHVH